ncbi:Tat pathway signal protein [Rhodococcus zopfii]|uniref:Tat pathway signal protein n=1 Tax=Rhodococcus zopfii TaxID=43772 RepID=UPI0009354CF6|nr:Tat pathway signal protein [Rhodococcus zopfii]
MRRLLATALAVVTVLATGVGVAGTASAAPDLAEVLDVSRNNLDSEYGGGVAPELSSDPEVLRPLLDRARAAGVEPERYAALLHQYWLAVAVRNAGIDLNRWDPQLGLAANEQNLKNTFAYYQKLQREHPDFLWAGQGGLAGPSFGAGIMDVDLARAVIGVRELRDALAQVTRTLDDAAAPASADLPEDLQAVLAVGHTITPEDIADFQVRVIAMSKHIFTDLLPQHEAYLAGGLDAIDEFHRAGIIDDRAVRAWRDLATGDPESVVRGNAELLHREQYQSIADQWDATREARGPVGRALTYLSTFGADPAIPGVAPPREAFPLTLTADDPAAGAQWRLQTPLPAFNWSDRDARWEYITTHMLPKYRALAQDRPAELAAALDKPMDQQFLEQRALMRLVPILLSVARTTQVQYS